MGAARQRYDFGDRRRRWRTLDLGTTFCFLEGDAPRVRCGRHGVVVVAVPWARHDSRFTRAFEDHVAWLACHCSKTVVAALMRVAWRTVGGIIERVAAEAGGQVDLLDGLRRIWIDEISHRTRQRYLTVVVDHHSVRLVWAAPGRDRLVLSRSAPPEAHERFGDDRLARPDERFGLKAIIGWSRLDRLVGLNGAAGAGCMAAG